MSVFLSDSSDHGFEETPVCGAGISVEQKDFRIDFDDIQRVWTVEWYWPGGPITKSQEPIS